MATSWPRALGAVPDRAAHCHLPLGLRHDAVALQQVHRYSGASL